MTTLDVMAVYFNEEVAEQIRAAVGRLENVNLKFCHAAQERPLESADLDPLPDLVIFEINGHNLQDVADMERLMRTRQDKLTVFVTYRDGDVPTMRRLMQAGVSDVFEQPIKEQELVLAATQVLSKKRAKAEEARGGRAGITAFIDAKGGSGATTLAVNVAEQLASRHKAKVAFIDLDLQFGSGALALDLEPRDTSLRALSDPQRIDSVFLDALMTKHDSGLSVLASPITVVPSKVITKEGVECLIETAAEAYEFVVLDLGRGLSEWEQRVLAIADPVVVVMQNNLATIRDAKLLIDKLPAIGVPLNRVEVVINRAEGKEENISDSQLAKILEGVSVHRVRNDYRTAATAQDEGEPVAQVGKRSSMTKDIAALAEYLLTLHRGEKAKKGGVFGHLFGRN